MPFYKMEINLPLTSLLVEGNNCFYVILDQSGHISFANKLFLRTIANPEIVLKHPSFKNFISEDNKQEFEDVLRKLSSRKDTVKYIDLTHSTLGGKTIKIKWDLINKTDNNETEFHCLGVEKVNEKPAKSNGKKITPEELEKILDHSLDVICTIDEDGKFTSVSKACNKVFGYEENELIGKKYLDFVVEEDRHKTAEIGISMMRGNEVLNFDNRYIKKNGSIVPIYWTGTWDRDEKILFCVARDGTLRKSNEETIKTSEDKYKLLFYNNPQSMWIYERHTQQFLEVNEAAIKEYGYSREEFLSMTIKNIRPPEDVPKLMKHLENGDFVNNKYWKHVKKNGTVIHVQIAATPLQFEGRDARLISVNDITEQVNAEEKLIKSNERYHYASKAAFDAIWDWDLITNDVYWSDGFEHLFGYKIANNTSNIASWYDHIHPKDQKRVIDSIYKSINDGVSNWEEEFRYIKRDGSVCYVINRGLIIKDEKDQPCRMIGAMQDHTEREKQEHSLKALNTSLAKRAAELASSNEELERFAYVASHDLQEPLRMVSSFLQLLQKRYHEKLDPKANEYIHFAVDGAERMKTLILDLLKFSRVNASVEQYETLDLNEICVNVLFTYKQRIEKEQAIIKMADLPIIVGNKTELIQLFQNLIGNALKYRSVATPAISIDVADHDQYWQFSISDNGIGIDPRFFKKIFVIFQRLHHKNEYSGTGIGLAICKKIVEKHGGKIWVNSTWGEGSIFYFTLPKQLQDQARQSSKNS